jgi:hypothetical protein
MNLERVEEMCLRHLEQSKNPLVLVDKLLEVCQRDDNLKGLNKRTLLEFLRAHGDIDVVDGMERTETGMPDLLAAAGIQMTERAILKRRMPTPDQLKELLLMQIGAMTDALTAARELAEEEKDVERMNQIDEALERARTLGIRVNKMA